MNSRMRDLITRRFLRLRTPRALAIATLALFALAGLASCNRPGSSAQAPALPPPPAVSVATVIEREVQDWDEFSGRLEAVERVDVRPRVSGYVQSIAFKEGVEVRKGDVLFVIDRRPYSAELRRAQAELESARSRAALSKSQLQRAKQLLDDKFISSAAFDERESGFREAEANIRAAQAAVDQARLNLEFTTIRAPISGRAGRAEVTVGNMVQSSAPEGTLLTTIVSLDPIYAYFEGDEQIYLKFAAAARNAGARTTRDPIYLGLANEEGFPHQGYLDFVDNRLDPATGTIRARAVFDNKQRLFTPGLFARLKLAGGGSYKALLIDDKAVGTDQSKKFVLVVGPEKKASRRQVKLGPMVDGLRVVREGLKPGEMIVVNGLQRIMFPDQPVTPQTVPMVEQPAASAAPKS